MKHTLLTVALISLLVTGCSRPSVAAAPLLTPTTTATIAAPTPTAIPVPTLTPTLSPTPDPLEPYTIDALRARAYGGGTLEIVKKVGSNSGFTRYIISYPSDGLTIAGFMDVPGAASTASTANANGPFPVIIALHGYIDPSIYNTLDYTTHYADVLATSGYLVLHPNLRNFPPSDNADDFFRTGMAVDVLNLIAIVKATGGQAGALQEADPARIGMWGHSMGGGVTTRVLTISSDVRAAVLYAPVSGDELQNYLAVGVWSNGLRGQEERQVAPEELLRISPMYFYNYVQAAVSINQGLADLTVPPAWSRQTCAQLQALGKTVECHYYDGQPHTFLGQGDKELIQNTLLFFDRYLRGP